MKVYPKNYLRAWFLMSRPPFHIVGVMPFVLGMVIAYKIEGSFNVSIFLLGVFAVILIMLSTYYNGEYYDIKEDKLAKKMGKNVFSGGSQIISEGILPRKFAKISAYTSLFLAAVIGILLQFYYKTGILTIPLGVIGMFTGFFYSKPPFRWVSRGIGEIFIGFSYGWLPIAVSYYLQTGKFDSFINWISIPVGLTIFNVILINEFPDYNADLMAGKKNIVVRIGKEKSSIIYIINTVISWVIIAVTARFKLSNFSYLFFSPFFIVSFIVVALILVRKYNVPKILEVMCGLTIVVNLGVILCYILSIFYFN